MINSVDLIITNAKLEKIELAKRDAILRQVLRESTVECSKSSEVYGYMIKKLRKYFTIKEIAEYYRANKEAIASSMDNVKVGEVIKQPKDTLAEEKQKDSLTSNLHNAKYDMLKNSEIELDLAKYDIENRITNSELKKVVKGLIESSKNEEELENMLYASLSGRLEYSEIKSKVKGYISNFKGRNKNKGM